MSSRQMASALLKQQAERYPGLDAQDMVKALYQACFGCGHFVPDAGRALAFLEEEAAAVRDTDSAALTEPIGDRYSRVHLAPYVKTGAALPTLARLFVMTSEDKRPDGQTVFDTGLCELERMANAGEIPSDADAVRAYLAAYREKGCPSVHHSQAFRERYAPAYRVVRTMYAGLLPLYARIDALLREKPHAIVAIDGMSGSGKTTLANLLAAVYHAGVLHMDDFFLQAHQRTPQRFAQPGGNVDYERFGEEVLSPLARGEAFFYRPYLCGEQRLGEPVTFTPGSLTVVEGSYSLHPALEAAYDLGVCLHIGPAEQSKRILRRNGAAMHRRFMDEWIPLENLYFEKTHIAQRCDARISVTPAGDDDVRYEWEEYV